MKLLPLAAVVAAGLLSRSVHTGLPIFDKYLGDALYAIMILLFFPGTPLRRRAPLAMAIVSAIEVFQLTGIPAAAAASGYLPVRLAGRLFGTVFSWFDLLAYAAGISVAALCIHARNGHIR
jgi:hypothetical protein